MVAKKIENEFEFNKDTLSYYKIYINFNKP